MLDVRRLRLLHDLDRLGTIAAVAAVHTYTPSAVSQQLSALEREAGTALLERTGRRVALTAAGQVLVRHAAHVLAALESADAALAAVRSGPAGPLRIGAFPSAVRTILPAALVTLGRDHPRLELMVTEIDPAAVPAALRDRHLDAGLTHTYEPAGAGSPAPAPDPARPPDPMTPPSAASVGAPDPGPDPAGLPDSAPPDSAGPPNSMRPDSMRPDLMRPDSMPPPYCAGQLDSVGLADEAVHLAVPAGDAATGLAALRDHDWILASPGTLCHDATVRLCRATGFTPRRRHQADDFAAVLALVAAGQGVALVPALGAVGAPPGVRLIPAPARRRTRVTFRRGAAAHPGVIALVSALRAVAAEPRRAR